MRCSRTVCLPLRRSAFQSCRDIPECVLERSLDPLQLFLELNKNRRAPA